MKGLKAVSVWLWNKILRQKQIRINFKMENEIKLGNVIVIKFGTKFEDETKLELYQKFSFELNFNSKPNVETKTN